MKIDFNYLKVVVTNGFKIASLKPVVMIMKE